MHRRLILMRHAKSSWKVAGMRDHERPLNSRGRRDAPRMARVLEEWSWAPSCVHASDAQRTRETWARMADTLPPVEASFHPSLYLGSLQNIRAVAQDWPDAESGPVLVLGHNPGWEVAASTLGGSPVTLTTANMVLLEGFGATWTEALRNPWTLVAHLRPRDLDSGDAEVLGG